MKIKKINEIDNMITIINIYAPTTERVKKNPNELEKLYKDLTKLIDDFKKIINVNNINRWRF